VYRAVKTAAGQKVGCTHPTFWIDLVTNIL
jgi:hypothetical protein